MTPYQAYDKAVEAGKRLPELEDIILNSPWYSYIYARDIIEGRWIESEDIIMAHPPYAFFYAVYVTEGKLPEKMHNMMLLHAIKDPNDIDVKEYFEYVSK